MEQPIRVHSSPEGFLGPGWIAVVTERGGGVSPPPFSSLNLGLHTADQDDHVRENERRVLAHLGINRLARADLVHGTSVSVVDAPGIVPGTDALITRSADLALGLTVADCYPVFLVGGPWRGLAHCGWRGVAGGLLEEVVGQLSALGAPAREARAWIGPGIGACCYEVGSEVAERFQPRDLVRSRSASRPHLDLAGAIRSRLERAGIPSASIDASGLCTACSTDRFFSHRAEGPTGRMSAFFFAISSS